MMKWLSFFRCHFCHGQLRHAAGHDAFPWPWQPRSAAANVVIVADTRRLDGIMLWWAQMYNDSHLYFTILTIIIIRRSAASFGFLADVVMSHIGIDLKHRELAETLGRKEENMDWLYVLMPISGVTIFWPGLIILGLMSALSVVSLVWAVPGWLPPV